MTQAAAVSKRNQKNSMALVTVTRHMATNSETMSDDESWNATARRAMSSRIPKLSTMKTDSTKLKRLTRGPGATQSDSLKRARTNTTKGSRW